MKKEYTNPPYWEKFKKRVGPYKKNIKKSSKEVALVWTAIQYFKNPMFTKWIKFTNSNSVRFEAYYKQKKHRWVREEYIEEHKVSIIIPPKSEDPAYDMKIRISKDSAQSIKKVIRAIITPVIKRFIRRHY